MNGELIGTKDGWSLRFVRRLPHPPERIWLALTEPQHLAAWFPQTIVGEWTAGAPLRFESTAHPGFDGQVLEVDPPRLLVFRWGEDTLRFEISADGAGSRLSLIDSFRDQGKAARDAAGWHTCLDLLAHHLDGTQAPWSSSQRWDEVHPGYVAELGAEASTIGPPKPPA